MSKRNNQWSDFEDSPNSSSSDLALPEQNIYFNISELCRTLTHPQILDQEVIVYEFGDENQVHFETQTDMSLCESNRTQYATMRLFSERYDLQQIQITPFDICIMDAVYSMLQNKSYHSQNGECSFTINQLANELVRKKVRFSSTNLQMEVKKLKDTGDIYLDQTNNPDRTAEEINFYNYLHLCVNKLSGIRILIDCSHLNPRGQMFQEKKNWKLKGYLLPVNIQSFETDITDGEQIEYTFLGRPVLYQYAEYCRHIASISSKALPAPKVTSKDSTLLAREVTSSLARWRNPHNKLKTRFVYEYTDKETGETKGLLARMGLYKEQFTEKSNWSRKKAKIHKDLGEMLEDLKERGQIQDYRESKTGRKYNGYDVII